MKNQIAPKKKWKWCYGWLAIPLLGFFALTQLWEYLPYQHSIAKQIKNKLAAYNLKATSLEVKSFNPSQIVLQNIKLGEGEGFSVDKLRVNYKISQLTNLHINEINAEDIKAHLYRKDKVFVLRGLEPLMGNKPASGTFSLEENLIPREIHIKNLDFSGADNNWSFETLLNADLTTSSANMLRVISKKTDATIGSYQLTSDNIDINASFNKVTKQLNGKILAHNLIISDADKQITSLQISANIKLIKNLLNVDVLANDNKKDYQFDVNVSLPLQNPQIGKIAVKHLQFPWGGGKISLQPTNIPLKSDQPIDMKIQLDKVQLVELLAILGEGKVRGTGEISGVLPIKYYPDGHITLQDGKAAALAAGLISVSPDLLPGDNAQLQVARKALENFHYTKLNISVSSNQQNKSTIRLTIEGSNPDAFAGRLVNMNVNLTGDILPLLQQSILPLNDLKKILQLKGAL